MATFRKALTFIRANPSPSLMFLIYLLMWWAPLRPVMTIASRRMDIPAGINGPLEWMTRWWLSPDSPAFFQILALIGAWVLALRRRKFLVGAWARTCRSASRRGAKWAAYSWIPLSILLLTGATAFLGHITPLAITTLVWLPAAIVFYIYGPRVLRALHTPMLLLIAATAVPDTIPELVQKLAQRILGSFAVLVGKILGDNFVFDPGSTFNVADDYLRSGSLNAPIAAPMNGLALLTSTAVISATWTLMRHRGIASTAVAKTVAVTVSGICVLAHISLIAFTLHSGQKGYTVASFHGIVLLPLTSYVSVSILKKLFTGPAGHVLRRYDRSAVLWFTGLPDIRRRTQSKRINPRPRTSKPAAPLLGVVFRMILSPFRIYWRWMTRLDSNLSKWEGASSRNKRSRK